MRDSYDLEYVHSRMRTAYSGRSGPRYEPVFWAIDASSSTLEAVCFSSVLV